MPGGRHPHIPDLGAWGSGAAAARDDIERLIEAGAGHAGADQLAREAVAAHVRDIERLAEGTGTRAEMVFAAGYSETAGHMADEIEAAERAEWEAAEATEQDQWEAFERAHSTEAEPEAGS